MKDSVFDRPVFIVSAPRAGSTLLYEVLSHSANFWTIGGESHTVIEGIPELRITQNNYDSNMLDKDDATEAVILQLQSRFLAELRDFAGKRYNEVIEPRVRFLEKTPKNSLRIDFLNEVFPDALFIFLIRDAKENISSIMEAWRSNRFVTYPSLPGWGGDWSLLLPPNWRALVGKPLVKIAALQWKSANHAIIDSLLQMPAERWTVAHYCDVVNNTERVIQQLSKFCQIGEDPQLQKVSGKPLALSRYTLTTPFTDKWRNNHFDIASVWSDISATISSINQFCELKGVDNLDPMLPEASLVGSGVNVSGLSRNALCPCGSGLRVKHCHGNYGTIKF
ncbi:sulfotransferase [Shewanella baltica]|uniref:sulfotransferase n=1 Tax=Shewanella baltica TaxID=62322 RepID=UPI003D7B2EE6